MSKKDEALKLALERINLHLAHHEHGCVYLDDALVAAIRSALAEPQHKCPVCGHEQTDTVVHCGNCGNVYELVHQESEQLEQQQDGPITEGWQITVAHGHAGYGVYAHMVEYPEEGAVLVLPIEQPDESKRLIECEEVLRSLACWLGVGGYNAPTVDAKVFEGKIRYGVETLYPPPQRRSLNWEPIQEFWRNNSSIDWDELEAAIEAAHGIKE